MDVRYVSGISTRTGLMLLLGAALGLAACGEKAEVTVKSQGQSEVVAEVMTRQGALESPGTQSLVIDVGVGDVGMIQVSDILANVVDADPATFRLTETVTENGATISLDPVTGIITYTGNPTQGWDRFGYEVCDMNDANDCAAGIAHVVIRLGACGGLQIQEDFRGTTLTGEWVTGGDGYEANLTAGGTSPIDADGDGWMRLSPAATKKNGYAFLDDKFPASAGVSMSFEVAAWGATNGQGGDGLMFFLVDGDEVDQDNFTLGGCCGSLGYAPHTVGSVSRPGMPHAVAGIAFDSWGGHWNGQEGRTGPDTLPPGATSNSTLLPNNITVRGGAATDWKTLFVERIDKSVLDLNCDTAECGTRPSELGPGRFLTTVTLTPMDNNSHFLMDIFVRADENQPFVKIAHADIPQPLPENLKLGLIGASGGGYVANHEARNLSVNSVTDAQIVATSSIPDGEPVSDGDEVTYTYTISNKTSGPICAADVNLVLPEGFTVTSQSCVEDRPNDFCGNFGDLGETSGTVALDGDGNIVITITGTVSHSSNNPNVDASGEVTVGGTQADSNPDDNNASSSLVFNEPTLGDRTIDIIAGKSESFDVHDDVLDGDNVDYGSVVISDMNPEPGVVITYDETTGEFTVTVDPDYSGPATVEVTYTIENDKGTSPPAMVTIQITDALDGSVDGSSDGEIWVAAGTPSVDVPMTGSDPIAPVTVIGTPEDSNGDPSGSTTENGTVVTFTPDAGKEDDPERYVIEVEVCAQADPNNCDIVEVVVVYNDAPGIDTPGGDSANAPLGRTSSLPFLADPGALGTIDPGSVVIVGGAAEGCAVNAAGDAVEFTPAAGTAVGVTVTCTLEVCEERPADLCTTQDFVFTTIEGFHPTDDTIDGGQGATSTVSIADLISNDGNADPGSFKLVGTPEGGSVSIVGGDVVFVTDGGATSGSFEYEICAAFDATDCETVTVTVDLAETPGGQDRTAWTPASTVPAEVTVVSPFDDPADLDIVVTSATGGSATIGPNGEVLVTPAPGHVGPVVVEVEGCTQTPVPACSTHTVTVIANDEPTINVPDGDQANAPLGRTSSLPFVPDAGVVGTIDPALTEIVGGQADGCVLNASGDAVEFTPAAGTTVGTTVSCTVQVCEALPVGLCTTQDFVFTVVDGFHPTAETIDGAPGKTSTVSIADLISNDGNVDLDSFTLVGTPEGGSVSIVGGDVVFVADGGATSGSFTYEICAAFDANQCETVTVTVSFADTPDGQNRTEWVLESDTDEEVTVASPFNDPADLDITIVSETDGTATVGPNGEILVTVEADYVGPVVIEVEGCTKTAVPACSTYTVTVIANDLPIVADGSAIVTPGNTQSVRPDASAGDEGAINAASLTLVSSETTANGVCGIDENNGKVTFKANDDAELGASETCTIEICELAPADACATADFTFEIQDIFNPSDDDATTLEETEIEILIGDLTQNDGNIDLGSFEIVGTPDAEGVYETEQGGLLTPNEDGDGFIYSPPAGFTGDDSFTYQICSGIDANDCEEVTVTIAVQEPVRITGPADGASTEDTTPTVTGTGQPDTEITITVDGEIVDTVIVDGDGNWEWTPDDELTPGEHVIVAEGDNGSSDEITISIEEPVAPRAPVEITSPGDASSTDNTQPTISGTGEPGAEITVSVDGVPVGTVVVDENGDWSVTLETELPPGDYLISATDEEGSTDSIDLTIDGPDVVIPDFVITGPTDGSSTDDPRPTISGTGTPGSTVTVTIDGEEVGTTTVDEDGNWSWTPDFDLDLGIHTIEAKDDAGEISSIELTVTDEFGDIDSLDGVFTGGRILGCASAGQSAAPVGFSLMALLVGGAVLRRRRRSSVIGR